MVIGRLKTPQDIMKGNDKKTAPKYRSLGDYNSKMETKDKKLLWQKDIARNANAIKVSGFDHNAYPMEILKAFGQLTPLIINMMYAVNKKGRG